jgi:hypothetical protein
MLALLLPLLAEELQAEITCFCCGLIASLEWTIFAGIAEFSSMQSKQDGKREGNNK